jgi:hypothetical protein
MRFVLSVLISSLRFPSLRLSIGRVLSCFVQSWRREHGEAKCSRSRARRGFRHLTKLFFLAEIRTDITPEVAVPDDLAGTIVKQYPLHPVTATGQISILFGPYGKVITQMVVSRICS